MATPSKPIILKITDAGKLGALNPTGDAVKLSVNLTHVAIGSGRYTPTGKETQIKNLIAKIVTASGDIDAATNTLQFSATIYADKVTPVYELGLLTETGALFAIAASLNEPLFTLYPNVTFVVAFGIALNEASSDEVTVMLNPNASLMPAIMQNHLAAPNPHPQYLGIEHLDVSKDPHPQYLDFGRFQLLLEALIPIGYLHHTHSTTNPKPQFDELLGINTAWRRLLGKTIVATDPADPFIKDVGMTLGQKGMTTAAGENRPHTYPLYTTNIFERYNPDDVIETVWQVSANKTSIDEGAAIRFTVSANNIPDGQILKWTVKEGALNSASNDVTAPDNTKSGSVILKNGSAIVDYITTPDDNIAEAQKHVRLTVGAPANLSINVPIMDAGRTEKFIHITSSTMNGLVLDEYYKQHSGAYPVSTDKVRFIVNEGVDIIAADTANPAILDGTKWPAGSQVTVENRGRILGRGGDGGRGVEWRGSVATQQPDAIVDAANWTVAETGKDGGTAVKGSLTIENYGLIASGGGGGGGGGAAVYREFRPFQGDGIFELVGGAGSGGGAPLGARSPNANTIESFYKYYAADGHVPYDYTKENRPMYMMQIDRPTAMSNFSSWYSPAYPLVTKNIPLKDLAFALKSPTFYLPNYHSDGVHYNLINHSKNPAAADTTRPFIVQGSTKIWHNYSVILRQSSDGGILTGGAYGYGGIASDGKNLDGEIVMPNYFQGLDVSLNHGGNGGDLGLSGTTGAVLTAPKINKTVGDNDGDYNLVFYLTPAGNGQAGFIKEGAVVINNFAGGSTKGR